MTLDPRLPTLEQVMNSNPFALIDTPWGKMEAWRASTMATGTMGALSSVYDIVRTDAAAQAARADEAEARNALIQHVCDKIAEFEKRFDALAARLAAAEDKRRADEAAARRFDEEPVVLPPDLAARQASSPASKIDDEMHHPSGDLHTIAPKEDAPASEEDDNVGDLPEELQLGEPSGPPEPKGHIYSQPTAISLNEA